MDPKLKQLLEAIAELGSRDLYTDAKEYECRVGAMRDLCRMAGEAAKGKTIGGVGFIMANANEDMRDGAGLCVTCATQCNEEGICPECTRDPHSELTAAQIIEALDANSGCIEHMACPKCGHYRGFEIYVTQSAMAYVHDEGTDFDGGDTEWDGDSDCCCPECNHSATVRDFQITDKAIERAESEGLKTEVV